MLSSVSKAFSSTKVAVSEAATKLSAKIAEAEKAEAPPDVCELKEVILNSEKCENKTEVKNVQKEPEACPVKPKVDINEMSEKLNKINVKLPVWQIKISDFLQRVQDYVNNKIQKK